MLGMCFIPGCQSVIGGTVDWVRQRERCGTWEKVTAWAVVFFGTLALTLTVVGFPLVISAWCIYAIKEKSDIEYLLGAFQKLKANDGDFSEDDLLDMRLELAELRGRESQWKASETTLKTMQGIIDSLSKRLNSANRLAQRLLKNQKSS